MSIWPKWTTTSAARIWELSVGRNDVYRIGRDAYGLQYFDALDGAELRYHNDKLAITTGYGKFKDGKKPGVDTIHASQAYSNAFSTSGLETGYGEIDAFFGGGKAARSKAGFYYNRLHKTNDLAPEFFAKYVAGYFVRGNYGKWSALANYEHISFNDGFKNVDGQDYGDAWMGTLQYGKADFHTPGSWDTWLGIPRPRRRLLHGRQSLYMALLQRHGQPAQLGHRR